MFRKNPRRCFVLRLMFRCFLAAVLVFPAISRADDLPWSFAPLEAQTLPKIRQTDWPQTRIDHFILAKLEAEGLNPAPPAESRVLLRRLHFDLTGLPPTPEQVASFRGISAATAKIEELLASPHFGEHWARHWLDLARYTDTTASWLKSTASAWLYRDWVIGALNDDLPYDQFVKRQLATDLIPETPPNDNAALGFLGLSPTYWKELQLPPEIIKTTVADEWEERIDAVGRTFLGLTLACARCHDHKSDPISTADYYALAGVFASVRLADRPTMPEDVWAPVAKARAEVEKLQNQQTALKKKKPKPEDLDAQLAALTKKIAAIKSATPNYDVPMVNGVAEAALHVLPKTKGHGTQLDYRMGQAQNLAVQVRGDPNDPGEVVPRRFLTAFAGRNFSQGSGRLELADAILNDARPLTARVIVNRVWRWHFGRGLVETPSDFGFMGEKPSHPKLLDDLAFRFVENEWSLKWLHREILNSATWRQSSSVAPESQSQSRDPQNLWLGRMNRRRLGVESWRDAMLAASGALDRTVGGQPADLNAADNRRRTIYGKIHRRDLNKMLQVHDFPDPTAHSPARSETTTPLQGLFALNGPLIAAQAGILAEFVAKHAESTPQRIHFAYQRVFQREPTPREAELGAKFLETADWPRYLQVLLGSNEFAFVD